MEELVIVFHVEFLLTCGKERQWFFSLWQQGLPSKDTKLGFWTSPLEPVSLFSEKEVWCKIISGVQHEYFEQYSV